MTDDVRPARERLEPTSLDDAPRLASDDLPAPVGMSPAARVAAALVAAIVAFIAFDLAILAYEGGDDPPRHALEPLLWITGGAVPLLVLYALATAGIALGALVRSWARSRRG